jgi:hypothetical protein
MIKMERMAAIFFSMILIALTAPQVFAQTEKDVCAVYFTYVGCPHCAITDPVVLVDMTEKYSNLVVIEYEFVLEPDNSYVLYDYHNEYECGTGVPLVVFGKGKDISGDTPIMRNIEEMIGSEPNGCPLVGGSSAFKDLDITSLPGKPKIWTKDRILIKTGVGGDKELLKELLITENLSHAFEGVEFEKTEPEEVLLSGSKFPQLNVRGSVEFEHAIRIGNWIFQWNGEDVQVSGNGNGNDNEVNHTNDTNNTQLPAYIYPLSIVSIIVMLLLIYLFRVR